MKYLLLLLTVLLTTPSLVYARGISHHAHYNTHRHAVSSNASGEYYSNSDGERIHRPMAASSKPDGASAQCRDGSYSFSTHRRGTCSHHGGVETWY